jgi:hypothetical protein
MTDNIEVPLEALQVVFDTAVGSMDFGSGFLDMPEVLALREVAKALGVPPILATPENFWSHFYDDAPVRFRPSADWYQAKEAAGE